MFFKRLFSRSNLELKVNDGGRAAAGYKGQAGDCVVDLLRLLQACLTKKFMMIYLKLMKNLEIHQELN